MPLPCSGRRTLVTLVTALVAVAGCAGARVRVRADHARYPISFSPALPDPQGQPAYLGEELEVVGTLQAHKTQVGMLYGATGGTLDISSAVNAQVAAAGGDGVVALAVTTRNCWTNVLFPLTILPVWPGCVHATVNGLIVKLRRAPATARAPLRPDTAIARKMEVRAHQEVH